MNSSPYLVVRRLPSTRWIDSISECLMVTPNQPNSDWGSTMPPTIAVQNPTGYQLRFFRVHWRSDTPFRAWFGKHFFYCSVFLLKLLVSIWQRVAHFLSLWDYGVSSCLFDLAPRPWVFLQRKWKTEILIFGSRWFKVVLSPGRSGVDAGRSVTGIWRAPRSHPDHSNSSRSWTRRISHHAHHPQVTITMSIILGIIMIILYMVKIILDYQCPENHKVIILRL